MKDEFRALVLSDMHLPIGESRFRALLEWRDLLASHDQVFLLGDTAAYYGTKGEYTKVNSILRELPLPYYVTNGNHEFSFSPVMDDDPEYGKLWNFADAETQRSQLRRFEKFFHIPTRYNHFKLKHADILFLGIDSIDKESSGGLIAKENELWLEEQLGLCAERPLIVCCHFPVYDEKIDNAKYYDERRRPYYMPPDAVREKLRKRKAPCVWISGHVHFNPSHPLYVPYRTVDGVWQAHCPDGFGYGRNQDAWMPSTHQDFYARSILISKESFSAMTFDVFKRKELPEFEFKIFTI